MKVAGVGVALTMSSMSNPLLHQFLKALPLVPADRLQPYRPEIDGLRAVAVTAVVLFHYQFGCPGGHLGVDIFFVISGYLISRNVWQALESGTFNVGSYVERRIRRIVPAAVVLTIAVLTAGFFIFYPRELSESGAAALAQSAGIANLFYWWKTSYFSSSAEEMPLLHTWSLSIEEQFYLLLPLLLVPLFRIGIIRRRPLFIGLLAVVISASAAARYLGDYSCPTFAFYGLPCRLWEFLCGATIVFLPKIPPRMRFVRESLAFLGVCLMTVSVFCCTVNFFEWVLLVCTGAALFIWSSEKRTVCGDLASTFPLRWLGVISYSLYLWHWPFLAFGRYLLMGVVPDFNQRLFMLVASLVCAALSWRFIELPARQKRLMASRRQMYWGAGVATAAIMACSVAFCATSGFPNRFSAATLQILDSQGQIEFLRELSAKDVSEDQVVVLGEQSDDLSARILVWGDSHAMAILPAVDALLKQHGMTGRAATHSACPPVLNWCAEQQESAARERLLFNDAVFAYILRHEIPQVILCCRWDGYSCCATKSEERFLPALCRTVRKLTDCGVETWVVLDVPQYSIDVPRAIASSAADSYFAEHGAIPAASGPQQMNHPDRLAELKAAGARIIDPRPQFLDCRGRRYVTSSGGHVLYRDNNHLTPAGAKIMLLPLLRDAIIPCRE